MRRVLTVAVVLAPLAGVASASDWPRFRGENGNGVSADSAATPVTWSETQNLKWSVDLPGMGVSSPIVVGDRVYVTCWTGAGPEDLKRHLMCYSRADGELVWGKEVAPAAPDEPYRGMFTQTGYTAHTPVSDGERIYCFFGVSGVVAFDLDGNIVWGPKSVGTGFDQRGWGSSSSPILYKDLVIVTAASESRSVVALRKSDGEEVWRQEADGLGGMWGTPVLMDREDGEQDIVMAVAGEIWGFNPATGKLRWHAVTGRGDSMKSSAIVVNDLIIVLADRGTQTMAVRGGGKGDVSETHVAWNNDMRGSIGTPVAQDGLVYWVADGSVNCIDAATGEQVYQTALVAPPADSSAAPPAEEAADDDDDDEDDADDDGDDDADGDDEGRRGRRGRRGRGGRGGGGFMSQAYSSPIIAGGNLYFTGRNGQVYVVKTGREFEQLAVNKFASDDGDFSATPAASDGELFIRSSKKLYCVAAK